MKIYTYKECDDILLGSLKSYNIITFMHYCTFYGIIVPDSFYKIIKREQQNDNPRAGSFRII